MAPRKVFIRKKHPRSAQSKKNTTDFQHGIKTFSQFKSKIEIQIDKYRLPEAHTQRTRRKGHDTARDV
jgi:hypothetical protein